MANQLAQMKTKSKGLSSKIIGFENVLSCQLNRVLIFCYIALHSQKTQPTIEEDVYVPRHFGCLSIHVCWFIVLHSLGGFSIPQFIRLHSFFLKSFHRNLLSSFPRRKTLRSKTLSGCLWPAVRLDRSPWPVPVQEGEVLPTIGPFADSIGPHEKQPKMDQ